MTTTLKYQARTEDGTLHAPGKLMRKEISEHFRNCDLEIIIRKSTRKRTNPENRYYWGCVLVHLVRAFKESGHPELSEHNPDDVANMHEVVKQRFFQDSAPTFTDPDGCVYFGKLTTTNETTATWEEKMQQIRTWVQESFRYTIPLPNEFLDQSPFFQPDQGTTSQT